MIELKNIKGFFSEIAQNESKKGYWLSLEKFLEGENRLNKNIFPPVNSYLKALELCPFEQTKVIIIGQDPYHGKGQANGLAFSVNSGLKLPPSLKNIFKEIKNDTGGLNVSDGNLEAWAKQGVLLLNTVLTVEEAKPGAHAHKGWETFTKEIITQLNEKKSGLVFMLWGNYAKQFQSSLDHHKHLILCAAHPSPLSAYQGFFNCKHFSLANNYLLQQGIEPIRW